MKADIEAITDFVCTHDLEHMTARQATPIVTQYLADRAKIADARYKSLEHRAEVLGDALHNELEKNARKLKKTGNHLPEEIPDNPVCIDIEPTTVRYIGAKPAKIKIGNDDEIFEPTMYPAEDNSNITILLQQLEALAQYVEHNLTNLQAMDDAAKNKARTILQGIIARLT